MSKRRLIGPIVAALVALGLMVVPAFATSTQQVLCSISADGTKSTYTLTQTTCGGAVAWPPANGMNNLQLVVFGQCTSTAINQDAIDVQFNNDATAGDYDWLSFISGVTSVNAVAQTFITIGQIPCHPGGGDVHASGSIIADIPFADSGAYVKLVTSTNNANGPYDAPELEFYQGAWLLQTTAAISRIDVGTASGTTFKALSHVELIGY